MQLSTCDNIWKEISNSWRSKIVPNHPLKIIPKCSPRICTLCKTVTLPTVSESWRDKKKVESRLCHKKRMKWKASFKQLSHQFNGPQSPLWPRFCRDHLSPPKITPHLPRSPPSPLCQPSQPFCTSANMSAGLFALDCIYSEPTIGRLQICPLLGIWDFSWEIFANMNYSMLTIKKYDDYPYET